MSRFRNDTSGAVVSVADEKDVRFGDGWTRLDAKPKVVKSDTPDESWTNKELDAYALEKNIDMGGASNKADRLAAIAAHVAGE